MMLALCGALPKKVTRLMLMMLALCGAAAFRCRRKTHSVLDRFSGLLLKLGGSWADSAKLQVMKSKEFD